jgi:hypothetical protein
MAFLGNGAVSTINGFNIGVDASITIADSFGDIFPAEALGHVMEFDSESEDVEVKVVPISFGGVPIYQTLFSGIRGRLMFTRVSGSFQSMIISLMNAYHDAGIMPFFSITQTVVNRDLSTDEYLYIGGQWVRPRFGNYRATKEVDLTLEFRAQRMIGTGGLTPFLVGLGF